MNRSPTVLSVALVATTLLALTPITTPWSSGDRSELSVLKPLGGRVEVTVDEQDMGPVTPGASLGVCFVVGNCGRQQLLLRQTPIEHRPDQPATFPTYVVSPRQRVAVTAQLRSDELAAQGLTHILFQTSDPHCPRLWLTVRGTVQEL